MRGSPKILTMVFTGDLLLDYPVLKRIQLYKKIYFGWDSLSLSIVDVDVTLMLMLTSY